MRARSHEWDLPDGVVDGDTAASAVVADAQLERWVRHLTKTYDPKRPSPAHPQGLVPKDADLRARLLSGARRGDVAAIQELRDRYRCWLLP